MPTELNAPITDVTVYTNRARVTRSGEIELDAGETTLILSGLPSVMDADSVRVSGKGAGITIRGVDVKPDVQEESDSNQTILDELDGLHKKAAALAHEYETLIEQLEYFKALKTQTSEQSGSALLNDDVSFAHVTQIADSIRKQMQKIFADIRDVEAQRADLEKKIQSVELRLAASTGERVKKGQAVHIAVEAEKAMKFTYEIEYLVNDAYWYPVYDARLLEDNSVELTYMAQVKQETGEDWGEVNLALSTARPALTTGLPEPKAWYVSDSQPYRPKMRQRRVAFHQDTNADVVQYTDSLQYVEEEVSIPNPMLAVVDAAQTMVGSVLPKAQTQQATISESSSGAVVTYGIGTPVSVPGSGEPHKTTITIVGLSAELDYVTAPRMAQEAYLRATVTNDSEYTILPGEASIFHGNDFVGKTSLKTIAPTEEFEVQLGVDERIKIERELVKRDTGTRFIGTSAQIQYRYEIEVTNLLQKEAKITVFDQYPVSSASGIKVKLDSAKPEPKEESDLHILTWELELSANEKRKIEIAFTVEHGRNTKVYGLDD